jgi:excisionase family DNA binding protein
MTYKTKNTHIPLPPIPQTLEATPVWLTTEEVAELLKVSSRQVSKYVQLGELKGYSVGRRWLISRADVDAYVRSQLAPPFEKAGN